MKLFKIVNAYPALVRLSSLKLPIKQAYEIYKLTKEAEDQLKFASEQERKIIAQCDGEIGSDGAVSIQPDVFAEFQKLRNELNQIDVEWRSPIIHLTLDSLDGQDIAPADIYSLEEFIEFE